jgi:NAD(P)-dependent dehydrogenase (short-subunit alcohol dehydrogenase family)
VVVNDLGSGIDGSGEDPSAAEAVVAEITAAGGEAVANADDVADWDGARRLVATAIQAFGRLHVLVNNAGILRDRFVVNVEPDEWDDVVRVHLRGHVAPTRWAAAHWRELSKAGTPVAAAVVNTTSTSGLLGNPGQSAYGAAKAGIAALTVIAAAELGRYGVRVNAIAPMARTRLTESTPGLREMVGEPADASSFDAWHPANVSPVVAWLATESCPLTGEVLYVHGATVQRFRPWTLDPTLKVEGTGRWTAQGLAEAWPGPAMQ